MKYLCNLFQNHKKLNWILSGSKGDLTIYRIIQHHITSNESEVEFFCPVILRSSSEKRLVSLCGGIGAMCRPETAFVQLLMV